MQATSDAIHSIRDAPRPNFNEALQAMCSTMLEAWSKAHAAQIANSDRHFQLLLEHRANADSCFQQLLLEDRANADRRLQQLLLEDRSNATRSFQQLLLEHRPQQVVPQILAPPPQVIEVHHAPSPQGDVLAAFVQLMRQHMEQNLHAITGVQNTLGMIADANHRSWQLVLDQANASQHKLLTTFTDSVNRLITAPPAPSPTIEPVMHEVIHVLARTREMIARYRPLRLQLPPAHAPLLIAEAPDHASQANAQADGQANTNSPAASPAPAPRERRSRSPAVIVRRVERSVTAADEPAREASPEPRAPNSTNGSTA
jgi:hypothetical protein